MAQRIIQSAGQARRKARKAATLIEARKRKEFTYRGLTLPELQALPFDEQMEHLVRYIESGKPIIGLRTATHAFSIKAGKTYAKYSHNSREWPGGFGRQVLGET